MNKSNVQKRTAIVASAIISSILASYAGTEPASGTLGKLSSRHYVQSGLVLHFDGIENAGAEVAHDGSAVEWKDLSSNGNHAQFKKISEDTTGAWLDNGFRFDGKCLFVTGTNLDIAPELKATVQTVSEYSSEEQRASYVVEENGKTLKYNFYPSIFGTGEKGFTLFCESTGKHLYFDTTQSSVANCWSWPGRYATAVYNAGTGYVFQSVTPVAELLPGTSSTAIGAKQWSIGCGTGAHTGRSTYFSMIGTVHAVRAYNRILTDDELKWNRIIDDYRYFGVATECLPTNAVVVVSETAGCGGAEPGGIYLPSGWTFASTSGVKTIGEKDYEVCGYVLETWDEAAKSWTDPVTNLQSASWMSPVSGTWPSVRLTWITRIVRGVVAVPDVGDYVQDGLVLHLDGYRNVGADVPHDATSTRWVDLAGGNAADITHHSPDSSQWTDDGYFFDGNTVAIMNNDITLFTTVTVQVACGNIDTSAQTAKFPSIMGLTSTRDSLNIYWNSVQEYWYLKVGDNIAGGKRNWDGDYLSAICTGEKKSFFDTSIPSAWGTWDKFIGTITPIFGGGRGHFAEAYTDWYLKGEIKNARIYDRALTNEELEKNREIDEVRRTYRPNVEVADGSCGAAVEEPGLYHVQGEWTFSATNVVDRFGCHRTVVGYTLEAAQDGAWGEPVRYQGSTYTHKVDEQVSDFVRLVWRLSPRGLRVIVR